jgi:hypothetical protein
MPGLGQGHTAKKDIPMLRVTFLSYITLKRSVGVICYSERKTERNDANRAK